MIYSLWRQHAGRLRTVWQHRIMDLARRTSLQARSESWSLGRFVCSSTLGGTASVVKSSQLLLACLASIHEVDNLKVANLNTWSPGLALMKTGSVRTSGCLPREMRLSPRPARSSTSNDMSAGSPVFKVKKTTAAPCQLPLLLCSWPLLQRGERQFASHDESRALSHPRGLLA